jgi:hypothetical protein
MDPAGPLIHSSSNHCFESGNIAGNFSCGLHGNLDEFCTGRQFVLDAIWRSFRVPRVSASIFVKLKSGRLIRVHKDIEYQEALAIKAAFESWLKSSMTISITTADGLVEDFTPAQVESLLIDVRKEHESGTWVPPSPS